MPLWIRIPVRNQNDEYGAFRLNCYSMNRDKLYLLLFALTLHFQNLMTHTPAFTLTATKRKRAITKMEARRSLAEMGYPSKKNGFNCLLTGSAYSGNRILLLQEWSSQLLFNKRQLVGYLQHGLLY